MRRSISSWEIVAIVLLPGYDAAVMLESVKTIAAWCVVGGFLLLLITAVWGWVIGPYLWGVVLLIFLGLTVNERQRGGAPRRDA
jgi:hypothetical protein